MAEIVKPYKIGNYWTNLVDSPTGESVNFEEVTTWWDGTSMDDSKVDGVIYRKLPVSVGGGYVRFAFDPDKSRTLVYKTMYDLTNRSSKDSLLINLGYYKDIRLNGYWVEGDGGGGTYEYNPQTPKTNHDGGCIISFTAKIIDVNTLEAFILGGTDIDPTGNGCFERLSQDGHLRGEVYGVSRLNPAPPTANTVALQAMLNFAKNHIITHLYIPPGVHDIVPALLHDADNTTLVFEGVLRTANGAATATGTQLIRYQCSNVTVVNQMLDGNRDNNESNELKGRQFSFTTYSNSNLTFRGGYCINALQSHLQSTSENVVLEDIRFENSGEHGVYLTLEADNPKQQVRVSRCLFLNYANDVVGTGISLRDYRNALIEDCYFDAGNNVKPEGVGHIQTYVEYDSDLGTDSVIHRIVNCIFLRNSSLIYSVFATDRVGESGTYIEGGKIHSPTLGAVIKISGAYIHWTQNLRWTQFPETVEGCVIQDVTGFWPETPFKFINNTVKSGGRESSGMFIDLNNMPAPNSVVIKDNKFYDFTGESLTFGIIRTKSGVSTVLENNELYNCDGARLARVRSETDVVMGNKNVTGGTVGYVGFDGVTPRVSEMGNMFRKRGTSAERPSLSASTVGGIGLIGYEYFDTTLNKPIWWTGSNWVDATGTTV